MNIVTNNKWIGQRTIRPDGADKVTGRAAFAADTNMPGMIWGKVLRSPHPHARIKSIDTSKAEALPGVKAVVSARDIVDFPIDKSRHARHPGHALDVPQRDGAREGAVPRPSHRGRRRHHGGDRGQGLRADRGGIRGAAVGDRDRRRDQAGRADPARLHEVRGQAVQHRRPARSQEGRRRRRLQGSRGGGRAHLHHPSGAPGLYRAARLPRQRRRRQQDHDLELEPGPVHGARDDGVSDRHSPERHPRHPRRNRRRLRRQDHRLSRAAGDAAGEKIRPSRQDGDDARGSDARDRADLGLQEHGKDRREEGRHHRRRARHLLSAGRRAAGLADPRCGRLQLLALRYPACAVGRL